jgi:hypothetical protein
MMFQRDTASVANARHSVNPEAKRTAAFGPVATEESDLIPQTQFITGSALIGDA